MVKKTKFIDISVTLTSGMVSWPGDPRMRITRAQDMDRGDKDNVSCITMSSHAGTHIDAPLHFFSHGMGIDKMPLDAVIGPARVIEIDDEFSVKPKELVDHRIRRGERVLFKTRNSRYCWKEENFVKNFVYISKNAAHYLASLKVRCVGVDYLSAGGYYMDGVETHTILLKAGVWIIEGLDLSRVKPGRYDLICLPLKILNVDGAPSRAVLRKR